MASQIEQLRASFDKMNTAQKKQFIDSLKKQLQNSKSAEHLKFLQECVSKYNVAVNGGSAVSTKTQTPTASASSSATAKSKQKNPLMGAVIALSVILIVVLVGGGAFVVSTLNSTNNTDSTYNSDSNSLSLGDLYDVVINSDNNQDERVKHLITESIMRSPENYDVSEVKTSNGDLYAMVVNAENVETFIYILNSSDDIDNISRVDLSSDFFGASREEIIRDLQESVDIQNKLNELLGKEKETLSEETIQAHIEARSGGYNRMTEALDLWDNAKIYSIDIAPIVTVAIDNKEENIRQGNEERDNEFLTAINPFIENLKKRLKDPSSLQIHEIRYLGRVPEFTSVFFDYSAKNSLGGFSRGIAQVSEDGTVNSTEIDSTDLDELRKELVEISWGAATIYKGRLP